MAGWYVCVERDPVEPTVIVGPYPTRDDALTAMEHSLLIQGLVEENALDCYVDALDLITPDLTDPDHTGKEHT